MSITSLDNRSGIVDTLLEDIAKRVQLSPTNFRLAVERYHTVSDWLDREGSPLQGLVNRLYSQGSMAVGSVISSKFDNDEFDIDVIAEMNIDPNTPPAKVLDNLFKALNGEKDSRYHGKVIRRSRCVTVQYEGMHLDVTPAVLLPGKPDRTSHIFHSNEEEGAEEHYHVIANPWGFADWFKNQMPETRLLVESLKKFAAEPVPEHEPHFIKPKPLLVLQLMKRWRNKNYDQREGRMPPSVMMTCLIGRNAGSRTTLFDELKSQAQFMYDDFNKHTQLGIPVEVENPGCPKEDIFTDRWPGDDLESQKLFTQDLAVLNKRLDELSKDRSLESCQKIMAELFGEKPTTMAIQEFSQRYSQSAHAGELRHHAKTGAVALASTGSTTSLSAAASFPTPKHTNFGSK